MPRIQKQFEDFHTAILFDVDSSNDLRDRRDTILNNLSDKISEDAPTYVKFTQGSYALYTGIIPLDGNPDFDIGIQFDCLTSDHEDPIDLKKYVAEALKHQGRSVKIRRPCVTVTYFKDEDICFLDKPCISIISWTHVCLKYKSFLLLSFIFLNLFSLHNLFS